MKRDPTYPEAWESLAHGRLYSDGTAPGSLRQIRMVMTSAPISSLEWWTPATAP